MKRNPSVAALVLMLTSFAQGSGAASATGAAEPDAADQGLREIVVTATRREERLQDVPISVSAVSQEALDSKRLRNIDDLTRLSRGVTFLRSATVPTIRPISSATGRTSSATEQTSAATGAM